MTRFPSTLSIELAILLLSVSVFAQDAPKTTFSVSADTRDAVRQLIGDTILNGQAYQYDEHLADMIGPRLTGSPQYVQAAQWAEQQFKDLGLSNVHLEEWTIPATWEPEGCATGEILQPVEHHLHIYSLGWSPSTPKGGVKGEVVYIPNLDTAALDAQKGKIAGAIALLDHESFGKKAGLKKILGGIQHLRSLGPAAIVIPGGANGIESMTSLNFSGEIDSVPEAQVGLEDVLLMKRLLDHGSVTIQFSFSNRIRQNVKVSNVVAEIPGSEMRDRVVIVGAHLDSWQPGTGAQDNGTGAAGVMETARAIMALHHPPRRTVRFILFGGEEEGLLGSNAYVHQHEAEMPNIDAVLITDTGAEPAKGWYVMGREDERADLAGLKPLLAGLGGDDVTTDTEFIFQTDHAGFDVLGVPTLVLWTPTDKYFKLHHKASDTFDSVVQKDLTQGVAVVAVTAYSIADNSEAFAPHYTPAEVQEMLKKSGDLDAYTYLKSSGAMP